jgi:hypothetical protein
MRKHVALRKTTVRDGVKHLPRPKMTQDVLFIGDRDKCQVVIDQAALLPNNQSTDQIEVELVIKVYRGQITYNSYDIHRNNGSR